MPAVKTAISLDERLFARVEKAAAEMEIARSQLFALAVEEFLERRRNESIVRAINEAHADYITSPDEESEEQFVARKMKEKRKLFLEDEW